MKKPKFKCSKCKKSQDELWQFSGYGGVKVDADKWYCYNCFQDLQKKVIKQLKKEGKEYELIC